MLLFSGKQSWQVRIGCLDTKLQIPKLSMMIMSSMSGEDYYFICLETFSRLSQSKKASTLEKALFYFGPCFLPYVYFLTYSIGINLLMLLI